MKPPFYTPNANSLDEGITDAARIYEAAAAEYPLRSGLHVACKLLPRVFAATCNVDPTARLLPYKLSKDEITVAAHHSSL